MTTSGCKSEHTTAKDASSGEVKDAIVEAAKANKAKTSTMSGGIKSKGNPEGKVKAFTYETPSPTWIVAKTNAGDGNYSSVQYSLAPATTKVTVTSIGLPSKGNDAIKLVNDCETEFAQGASKYSDSTREWISHGFSISRFADPATGKVMAWCTSETSKICLNFEFGTRSKAAENVKVADSSTEEFFAKNPTGGAVLK